MTDEEMPRPTCTGGVAELRVCRALSVGGYRHDVMAAAKEEALFNQVPHGDGANCGQENGRAQEGPRAVAEPAGYQKKLNDRDVQNVGTP